MSAPDCIIAACGAMQWVDGAGNTLSTAAQSITCPGAVIVSGALPFPAGTAQGAEIDLPITGILTAATCLYIANRTGQELGMAWGGSFMPSLPPGGTIGWAFPESPTTRPITSLRFFLTEQQAAYGFVSYWAGGA